MVTKATSLYTLIRAKVVGFGKVSIRVRILRVVFVEEFVVRSNDN